MNSQVESRMDKMLCPTLDKMLKKTLMALCEVNVRFNQKLEVSGSVQIRSDGDKVLTLLLDEELDIVKHSLSKSRGITPDLFDGVDDVKNSLSSPPPAMHNNQPSNVDGFEKKHSVPNDPIQLNSTSSSESPETSFGMIEVQPGVREAWLNNLMHPTTSTALSPVKVENPSDLNSQVTPAGVSQLSMFPDQPVFTKNGVKKWQCSFCGILVSSKFYLRSHVNAVHTRTRCYPCEFCGKMFYSHGAQRIHKLRNHWVEKRHKCPECEDLFVLPIELRQHLKKKHSASFADETK